MTKNYPAICGICKRKFTYPADFLSCITYTSDGTNYAILSGACPEKHPSAEVQAAYFVGWPNLTDRK